MLGGLFIGVMLKVCIVNFNTQRFTDVAIMSLNKHTPGCEVFVFDNSDKEPYINQTHIEDIEHEIDRIEGIVGPLACFLVPGDTKGGAMLDLARTIARRAERQMLRLAKSGEEVHESDRLYINRLSDYCFMLMRYEEHKD